MVAPKSLLFQLHRHWEVVEALVLCSREHPAFEFQFLVRVIEQHKAKDIDANGVLSSLLNASILLPMSRTEDYQLNSLVIDFARGLMQEQALGLSDVLKVRVEAIKDATSKLLKGLDEKDNDLLRSGAQKLAELTRQISQQLEQDKQAIFEIAEQAKSADTQMPMERRYREVLEVYDQYVEPMNEMMDTGISGYFYPLLESAELALDKVNDVLSIRGSLYQQRLAMRQIAYQVKDLRYQGRITAQQCASILLPLREDVRKHNRISAVIGQQLGFVRKKGLVRGLPEKDLPIWKSRRSSRIQLGNEIRQLMAEFIGFEAVVMPFPEQTALPENTPIQWVDKNRLRAHVVASLPIENLMEWLKQFYSYLPDAELLRLYHDLVRDTEWQNDILSELDKTKLHDIYVHYHPHQLYSLEETAIKVKSNVE